MNTTMVTIKEAARLLTLSGDTIDASNVSRYVARWKIPSVKEGRERKVDLAKLVEHRRDNVQVLDKQSARAVPAAEVFAPPPAPVAAPLATTPAGDGAEDDVEPGSVGGINLLLKQLEYRKKKREEDLADGTVVPFQDALLVIGQTMQAFVGSLERMEVDIAQRFGRDTSAAVRKGRKTAQGEAARTLSDLARRHLPASMGGSLAEVAPQPEPEPEPEPEVAAEA